ncbi:dynein axonemal heavy chain 3-like isoform 2-T2 [Spinachia spinachia]
MFCLHAGKLNEDLCDRAERLKDKIIMFEMKEHRELNEGICLKYEEITETIRNTPETTEELVSLNQYIKITSDVTTRKLIDEIDEARCHLSFLLDYATLPFDDLKLNACVYHWPNNILAELEDSRTHLVTMKEQAQDFLQNRVLEFHQRLKDLDKEIRVFEKKDVITTEEIKNNVRNLTQITANLEAAVTEQEVKEVFGRIHTHTVMLSILKLRYPNHMEYRYTPDIPQGINNEQNLLEMEQRQYPLLQTLIAGKLPYEQLWTTALNFQSMSEEWMNGPFLHLDAEKISDDLDIMHGTMLELTESFLDRVGPYRVAKSFKRKIEKFKQHLPILKTICNPAIKDRHWEAISGVVGFAVTSNASRSLQDMLDLGISKFSDK